MSTPTILVSATAEQVEQALSDDNPVLLFVTKNNSVAADIKKALTEVAEKYEGQMTVYTVNANEHQSIGERFNVGKHPVLIGWHDGDIVVKRNRPWATDINSVVDKLSAVLPLSEKDNKNSQNKETQMTGKPVTVTDQTFQEEVLESDVPVLVDFWAEWCGPCRMVAPILEKLAGEYDGKVKIAKVDVDANPGLSQAFRIMSIPTLMFVKEGKIVGQNAGAAPEPALRDALEQLIELEVPA